MLCADGASWCDTGVAPSEQYDPFSYDQQFTDVHAYPGEINVLLAVLEWQAILFIPLVTR